MRHGVSIMSHDTIKRWLRPGAGLASGLLMCPLWWATMSYMPIVMPCDNTRDDNHFPMAITSAYTTPCVKVCLIAPDIFEGIELIILCLACEWLCGCVTMLQCEKIWAVIRAGESRLECFPQFMFPLYCNVTVLSLCQGWKGTLVQIWLSTHPIISLPKRDSITELVTEQGQNISLSPHHILFRISSLVSLTSTDWYSRLWEILRW